ncbi:hypothetical protein HYS28_00325 [Candidatus Uhrbacteria bacterium]|nr:hypothetical protein [Candidatus Uhrbacteria bacterium]
MSLLPHEQFLATLKRAERPVIMLPEMAHTDDFATAFGLAKLLAKLGKTPEIATSGGAAPKQLAFLGDMPVRGDLPNIRSLTITVDVAAAKVDELSYAVEDDRLRIHLTPKSGAWSGEDVEVMTTSYRYDLIITIGAHDLASLGTLGGTYADFLFSTPIIAIDHGTANEHFGALNMVDMGAVANGEVCFELMCRVDESLIDEDIATCFLTGMIAKTKSFKTHNVTPKTLKVAGSLMNKGARRDEIIEKLYRTRSVETLRLWGRALARLKVDEERHIVWTLLTRQDFVNAGADEAALGDIVEELLASSPEAQIVVIFYEHKDGYIAATLHAERPHDALQLGAPFKASGTREAVRLTVGEADLVGAERIVISHLQKG